MKHLVLFESFKSGINKLYKEYQDEKEDVDYKFNRNLNNFYDSEKKLIDNSMSELSEFYDATYESVSEEGDEHFMVYVTLDSTNPEEVTLFSNTLKRFKKKVEHEFDVEFYNEFTKDFDDFIKDGEDDGLWDCLDALKDSKMPMMPVKIRIRLD